MRALYLVGSPIHRKPWNQVMILLDIPGLEASKAA